MTQSYVVESVHWTGRHGGAIFTGRTPDGHSMRVILSADTMPRPPRLGEIWGLRGRMVDHPRYGHQLQAASAVLERPTGDMVINFLRGPSCPGIGQVRAHRLYQTFGDRIYDLLDAGDPGSLQPVIGHDLAFPVMEAWAEQTLEAATYRWLDSQGLPTKLATQLAAIYGDTLPHKAAENPYRLMAFLPWRQVEALARANGVSRTDPRRLIAGVEAAVYARLGHGHTATEHSALVLAVRSILECSEALAINAVSLALEDNAILQQDGLVTGLGAAAMEVFISDQISIRLSHLGQTAFVSALADDEIVRELDAADQQLGYSMNQEQRAAVAAAIKSPLSVLTGGAGTGKTTALRAIHEIYERNLGAVYQVALAGRAAQRMVEATGRPAMTIARFLNLITDNTIDEDVLSGGLLIIDEASMLDLPLTYRLLKGIPNDTRLMLVGDPGQLPPIGFGLVLHVLAESKNLIPKNHLVQVHRQAASTGIPAAAAAIRVGELPVFTPYEGQGLGVSFIVADAEEIPDLLVKLMAKLGESETQIISALRIGNTGTNGINRLFHDIAEEHCGQAGQYLAGEPIIWTRNDYDLELMNGSLGIVTDVCRDGLHINFEGQMKLITGSGIDNLDHAYAITVHKAQGSQFRRILMPITNNRLLDRTMIYTALTRAQEQVVFVGDYTAFRHAVTAEGISDRRQVSLRHFLAKRFLCVASSCDLEGKR